MSIKNGKQWHGDEKNREKKHEINMIIWYERVRLWLWKRLPKSPSLSVCVFVSACGKNGHSNPLRFRRQISICIGFVLLSFIFRSRFVRFASFARHTLKPNGIWSNNIDIRSKRHFLLRAKWNSSGEFVSAQVDIYLMRHVYYFTMIKSMCSLNVSKMLIRAWLPHTMHRHRERECDGNHRVITTILEAASKEDIWAKQSDGNARCICIFLACTTAFSPHSQHTHTRKSVVGGITFFYGYRLLKFIRIQFHYFLICHIQLQITILTKMSAFTASSKNQQRECIRNALLKSNVRMEWRSRQEADTKQMNVCETQIKRFQATKIWQVNLFDRAQRNRFFVHRVQKYIIKVP